MTNYRGLNSCEVFVTVVDEFPELERQLRDLMFLQERGVRISVLLNAPLAAVPEELLTMFPSTRFLPSEKLLPADENWQRVVDHLESDWFKIVCVDDHVYQVGMERECDLVASHPLEGVSLIVGQRKVRFGGQQHDPKDSAVKRPIRVRGTKLRVLQKLLARNFLGEPFALWINASKFRKTTGFLFPLSTPGVPFLIDFHMSQSLLNYGDVVFSRSEVGSFAVHSKSTSVRLGGRQFSQVREYYLWLREHGFVGFPSYYLALTSAAVQVAIRVTLYRLKLR